MKVLWITNILLPDISEYLNRGKPITGGWMAALAENLIKIHPEIELSIASLYGQKNDLLVKKINNITYYCLPFSEYDTEYSHCMEAVWKTIKLKCQPDVVHIHGTEYPYGLSYIRANGASNVVVSIQGLISVISRYALGQISPSEMKKYRTLYDLFRSPILQLPLKMQKQGQYEFEYINSVNDIIGRTEWDRSHIWAINRKCNYHFCNEILRPTFYDESIRWNIQKCEKHSIFVTQAYRPIKGIHKLLEALPLVTREFPDAKVYIAGKNFLYRNDLKSILKFDAYANYIFKLIRKNRICDKVLFTGPLNENQIAERYASSHIFVCPSAIENSPNSLGEAQIIGTPSIASYVGGVPNMIEHKRTGLLYRFEEHEMLAYYICQIFKSDDLALKLSTEGKIEASKRHNPITNAEQTYKIYQEIFK